MKCPVCVEADLAMTDHQGIEIDYCPKCRGCGWTVESWIKLSRPSP